MDASTLFPDTYARARKHFRDAAASLGAELEAHSIHQRGPNGEDLCVDVAILSGPRPERTLIISSGLHGIEGALGSAVQTAMLREWAARRESLPTTRCVLLHALNPFGYAWRRRVNEMNVDLNRNLLLEGQAFSGSPPGYGALEPLLNPKRAPSRWEPVALKFAIAILRHGMPALKQSVASGQYDYPQGLFYGGERPSRTSEILTANFERWLANSSAVMHLDFHTGLGAAANCKLLIDSSLGPLQRQRLSRWFGPDSFEDAHAEGMAYTVRGGFGPWCMARRRGRDYLFATAEFGTYAPTRVLAGLRAENQAQHWAAPESASTELAKRQLLELFCPRSARWRSQALAQGVQFVQRAIVGLTSDAD